MFQPYTLRKGNPRNNLSTNVRYRQKLMYDTSKKFWYLYTWWHGKKDQHDIEQDDMLWTRISTGEAWHFYKHLEIPIVRTQNENDWDPLYFPSHFTHHMIELALLNSLPTPVAEQARKELRSRVEKVEDFRQVLIGEGHDPHISIEAIASIYAQRHGKSIYS